jgi:hypothetical protein
MILAIVWFATKTCQPLTFDLPNPWQIFYLTLACQIHGKPIRPVEWRESCNKPIGSYITYD